MATYQVGKDWFFPELGTKPAVGTVIELPDDAAARYMANEPGLLQPARQTAQAHPDTVRQEAAPTATATPRKPRGRKPRAPVAPVAPVPPATPVVPAAGV